MDNKKYKPYRGDAPEKVIVINQVVIEFTCKQPCVSIFNEDKSHVTTTTTIHNK